MVQVGLDQGPIAGETSGIYTYLLVPFLAVRGKLMTSRQSDECLTRPTSCQAAHETDKISVIIDDISRSEGPLVQISAVLRYLK